MDTFTLHHWPETWGGYVGRTLNGLDHRTYYEKRFSAEAKADRLTVLEGNSADKLAHLADASVDVFYVDADHSYEAVKADLSVIKHKIVPNGIIIMNDYTMFDQFRMEPYGVVQATNEFMIENWWEMIFFALHREDFHDIAMRKLNRI
jgi:hypothetical protein